MNKSQKHWQSALVSAIQSGKHEIVKHLIKIDSFDINAKDRCGWAPITVAAALSKDECLKFLLHHDKIDVNTKDSEWWTPLMYAVLHQSVGCVNMLLKHKDIDIYAKNILGDTCLDIAKRYTDKTFMNLIEKKCRQIA